MALTINLITDQTPMAMFTVPSRIYLNSTRDKVVPESSEEAAYLLAPAGGKIRMEEAIKFGLVEVEVKEPVVEVQPPVVDTEPEPEPETKAVESGLDKAVRKFRDK